MKVCIVTVYNSINSGSYWQAFALGWKLEQLGHKVCYYKREAADGSSNSKKSQVIQMVKTLLKYGAGAAIKYGQMVSEFQKCEKRFSVVDNDQSLNAIDCFILGSDTIWNLQSEYFKKNYDIFFGRRFLPKRVVSFAASLANTTKEEFASIPELSDIVNHWDAIGVRDTRTKEIISDFSHHNVFLVCDPTLLLDLNDYKRWVHKPDESKYIFVYAFERLSRNQAEELVSFAKENQLIIINGGARPKPWYCDKTIVNSPDLFLDYMYYAEYVVTDTFHGTAFSINFKKNFAVAYRNKKKVIDLLHQMDLDDRLVTEKDSLVRVLKSDIKNQDKLTELREASINFLKGAIGGEHEGNQ